MANNNPGFITDLFRDSTAGSTAVQSKVAGGHLADIVNLGSLLNGEFDKITSTSRLYSDSYINRNLNPLSEIRTGEDLVKNINILDKNIAVVDNKVRTMDRSIRAHTSLLEYNKRLMDKTNDLINRWVRDSNQKKFSDIEDKMERRPNFDASSLDSIIDKKIAERMQGQMSSDGSGGSGGLLGNLIKSPVTKAIGAGAEAAAIGGAVTGAGGAITSGITGAAAGVTGAITGSGPALLTLLRASMPVAAASALAYVLATPDGQNKAIDFAAYLDKRHKQIDIDNSVKAGQTSFDARMRDEYRKKFAAMQGSGVGMGIGIGPDSTVTQNNLAPLTAPVPGTSVRRSVPLTLFDSYMPEAPNYDGPSEDSLVPTPVVPKPGDRSIPSIELDGPSEDGLVPTPVVPKPGDRMLPSIEDQASNGQPYRLHTASLGNGLDGLSTEQLDALFGRPQTVVPNIKTYQQNVDEEKSTAARDGINDFIEQYNLYFLKSNNFDLSTDKASVEVKDILTIDATNIILRSKQKIVISAPIIEMAGKITYSKSPVSDSYTGSNNGSAYGGPASRPLLGNDVGMGGGSFSPGLPSLGNNQTSSGTGAGNGAPSGPVPMGASGKDESRLQAMGPDGKPITPSDNSNAAKAFRFFKDKGYSDAHASAIVGNLMQESGPNLNKDLVGDGGNAFGIAQWNINGSPDRFVNFKKQYGIELQDATFEQQLAFIDWELHNSEKSAGNKFFAATDTGSAAKVFDQYFERSDGNSRGARAANAERVLGNSSQMLAGGSQGLPSGAKLVPGDGSTSSDIDSIPDSQLDMTVKTYDRGLVTLRELGITKFSELNKMGGQAFSGGQNDPNTTYALGEIAKGLGNNFGAVTAQNDQYHHDLGRTTGHVEGVKGDFTVNGITYPAATSRTKEILESMGLVAGEDFKLIDEASNPSANATGNHIDFTLTPSGQSKVGTIRSNNLTTVGQPTPVAQKGNRDGSVQTAMDPRQDTGQKPTGQGPKMGDILEHVQKPVQAPIPQGRANQPDRAPSPPSKTTHSNTHDKMLLTAKTLVHYASTRLA